MVRVIPSDTETNGGIHYERNKGRSLTQLENEAGMETSPQQGKLSLVSASVFIVGQMAGSGILALPYAVKQAGWAGAAILVVCCLAAAQAAVYLGRCWCIIEERWPEHKCMEAEPYSIIGLRAIGGKTQVIVSLSVSIQLYLVATVFLAIGADLVVLLTKEITLLPIQLTTCEWVIILGLLALPFMMLPTPSETSWVAYTAMSSTVTACVLLIVAFGQELFKSQEPTSGSNVTTDSFFRSLGTFTFVYGGAATFPTFQSHMKRRCHFPYAVFSGFTMLLILYLPIAVFGYFLYGGDVKTSILNNIPDSMIKTAIEVFMAFHVFAALLIVINPVNMAFEETIGIGRARFSLSKTIVRTAVGLSMIAVVLTIPTFDKILNLVGGTTVSSTSSVFPPLFYLALCRDTHIDWPDRRPSLSTQVVCYCIVTMGVVAGCVATYSAVNDIISPDAFTKPCYI